MNALIQRALIETSLKPTVRTIAWAGSSSISYNHAYGSGGVDRYNFSIGFCNWLHAALDGRVEFSHNPIDNTNFFGYWGGGADLIRTTYAAAMIAAKPDLCVLYISLNDVSAGATTGAMLQSTKTFYHELRRGGCPQVMVMAAGPRNEAQSSVPGYFARRIALNKALRAWCENEGIVFYDDRGLLDDAATGEYLAGMSSDGTHLNQVGAARKGIAMANWMAKTFSLGPSFFTTEVRNSLYGANPFLTGSPQATGFNRFPGSRTTPTKAVAADGGHDWQQIVHAPNAYADYMQLYYGASVGATYALPAGLAAGDYVRIVAEAEVDNSGPYPAHGFWSLNFAGSQNGTVTAAANGNATTVHSTHGSTEPGSAYEVVMPKRGIYVSPVMQIAANTTAMSNWFSTQGGGTVRIRDFGFQKVNGYEPKNW